MVKWNSTYNENNYKRLDFKKSLPPADGEYLPDAFNISNDCLFTDGKIVYIGYCGFSTDENGVMEYISWYSGSESFKIENVTHWANLPDLPQE